eukprot:1953722-Prymnesium_polylepis.1
MSRCSGVVGGGPGGQVGVEHATGGATPLRSERSKGGASRASVDETGGFSVYCIHLISAMGIGTSRRTYHAARRQPGGARATPLSH